MVSWSHPIAGRTAQLHWRYTVYGGAGVLKLLGPAINFD